MTFNKKLVVMKFGGAAMATPEKILHVADIIISRRRLFENIIVVVSAMGKTTDSLINLAHQIYHTPPQREYDMLITVGERISMSLLAMALIKKKHAAVSLTGSQSGIITSSNHTNAKILDVRPYRILTALEKQHIVIVAGFQGVSEEKEITTLGRGGSDTSAVALGIALKAERVEFYKDVNGVFNTDPKIDPRAKLMNHLSYKEALDLVQKKTFILHPRSVELARNNSIPLAVFSFKTFSPDKEAGTLIYDAGVSVRNEPVFELT